MTAACTSSRRVSSASSAALPAVNVDSGMAPTGGSVANADGRTRAIGAVRAAPTTYRAASRPCWRSWP